MTRTGVGTVGRVTVLPDEDGLPGGLVLRRAWPRGPGHLLLELRRPDGRTLAAQLLPDRERAARVAARTAGTVLHPSEPVVLHPDGADRVLHPLAPLVAQEGSALVVHRPERRAVVRRPDGRFAKVVRPDRVARVADAHWRARAAGLPVASLVAVRSAGVLEWDPAPGRPLADLLADTAVPVHELCGHGAVIGEALRRLHAVAAPTGTPRHEAADEVAATRRWVEDAAAHGLDGGTGADLATVAHALRADAPATGPALVHRDLHEKQVVLGADGRVTFLDVDTVAVGEPAVDVANLLVHLELAVALGTPCDRVRAVATGLLESYDAGPDLRRRLPAYVAATVLRLRGVHAFRPASAAAARRLDPRLPATLPEVDDARWGGRRPPSRAPAPVPYSGRSEGE